MPLLTLQSGLALGRYAAPAPPPPVYPTGPHMRLVSEHGAAVVRSQDGQDADVRLVRPVYPFTSILSVTVHNTSASPSSRPYWGDRPGFLDTQNAADLSVNRELTSADDGSYATQIYQELDDGTFLVLRAAVSVAPTADGPAPAPTAPPPKASTAFFEGWDDSRRGFGSFRNSYGTATVTAAGTLLVNGRGSANQPFDGPATNFGNGLYEYRTRFIGADIGDGSGPCQLLWPADDVWNTAPGMPDHWAREIDLGELMPDGTFYCAIHWTDRTKDKNDGAAIWAPKDNPRIAPGGVFDHTAFHVIGARLRNDRVVLYVDGHVLADVPEHPAPDFANGGVNHGAGVLCNSSNRGLETDWFRFTSEKDLPPL